uniref:PWWP domain-containing protein n=1 Tax=Echinostoma caproni TaxID=27848 RepID=A0A183AYX6_9TREM
LNQTCMRELNLMRACPVCYLNRMQAIFLLPSTPKPLPLLTKKEWLRSVDLPPRSTETDESTPVDTINADPWWFCKLCDVLHPLVWVRLEHYPRWPAKVMTADAKDILVMFFGDYDVTMAPVGSARVHSDSRAVRSPLPSGLNAADVGSDCHTTSDQSVRPVSPVAGPSCSVNKNTRHGPKSPVHLTVDACYKQALVELDYHVARIKERYPNFKFPNSSVEFTRRYYVQFRKTYDTKLSKNARKVITSGSSNSAPCPDGNQTVVVEPATISEGPPVSTVRSICNQDSLEPVPSPASPVSSNLDQIGTVKDRHTEDTNSRDQQLLPQSSATLVLKVDATKYPNSNTDTERETLTTDDCDRPPTVLQPIPIIARGDDCEGIDEVRSLLERMRSQFQESLQCLEEKWHLTRVNEGTLRLNICIFLRPPIIVLFFTYRTVVFYVYSCYFQHLFINIIFLFELTFYSTIISIFLFFNIITVLV